MQLIPDKNEFMNEVESIKDVEVRNKLLLLYNHFMKYEKVKNVSRLVKEVLNDIFNYNGLSADPQVPLSFHFTAIGRVVFGVLYNQEERVYSVKELMEFTKTQEKPEGLSKGQISQDFSSGKLKGDKKGGRIYFNESQVNEYLVSKGLKPIN